MINIFGLSIGMISCIIIFLFIWFQLSFDKGFVNENRIYRFVTNWNYAGSETFSQGIPIPLAEAARNELSGIEQLAVIIKKYSTIHVKSEMGKELFKSDEVIFYTEPEFFDIFNMTWIFGKPSALTEPNTTVLSESTAIRLFGSPGNALGRSILTADKINLRVTGIFKDLPANSSFPLHIVISYKTFNSKRFINWDAVSSQMECYMLLKPEVDLSDFNHAIALFNKRHYGDQKIAGNQSNSVQALREIHFSERYGNFANTSNSKNQIYILGIIGLFLMLTACVNFINLSTAQAVNRAKEIGIRKVMGGRRSQLLIQFLTETLTITLLALVISCASTELLLPTMQNLFKDRVVFDFFGEPIIFIFLGVLVVVVSFFAGFYPAMVISGYSPTQALKNKVSTGNSRFNLRKVLVVGQFTITIVLLISTIIIFKQMKYVREKSLGFNADAVSMVNLPHDELSKSKLHLFGQKVLQVPGIKNISYCSIPPLSEDVSPTSFNFNGKEIKDFEIRVNIADENYFKLFNLKMSAGSVFFKSDSPTDCVVNETFTKKMNLASPSQAIGKLITVYGHNIRIIGVVKDFNDKTLKEVISPIVIYPDQQEYTKLAIKTNGRDLVNSMKKIEAVWNEIFPDYVFTNKFVEEDITAYYETERLTGELFLIFSGIIISIALTGLFGLISFVAAQRSKEVAIRKVLGASTIEIIKMLNWSFFPMVLLANLVAWPLAYFMISKWLSEFEFRIELTIWPFIISTVFSLLVTLITVTLRSYKAAVSQAVDSLKYD
jgi:putative ABC transport system permease protein